MSEKHTCCAKIYTSYWSKTCGKGAAYEHEGKWYCKTHHPPTVKAKSDERNARWQAEWNEKRKREQAARDAAAEQKRRADCYDQLVERVKELEEALTLMVRTHDEPAESLVQEVREQRWLEQARAALSTPLPNTVVETPK